MAYNRKPAAPAQPASRFCPHCQAGLAVNKAQTWVYCPNKYTARACTFKGMPANASAKVTSGPDEVIEELKTASDEQKAIFAFCETGRR